MSEINKRIEALEAELQKLKNEVTPKFEVGKWYKTNCLGGSIFYLTESPVEDCYVSGYGFENGDWCDLSEHYWTLEQKYKPTLATHQEVKEALIKEAKKRGFKEGVRINHSIEGKGHRALIFNDLSYHSGYNWLCDGWGNVVFKDGVWTEIIKDEPIKIGGYSVEKMGESYRVGCKRFEITDFIDAKRLIEKAGVKSLRFESIEINIETINKILAL